MPDLTPAFFLYGFIWYVVFLFSTTCHEAAHAWVARRGGDETAAKGGQVSLNPIPHIQREPFGMVLVPLLSYVVTGSMIGWASAPLTSMGTELSAPCGLDGAGGPSGKFYVDAPRGDRPARWSQHGGWLLVLNRTTGVRSLAFITLIIFFSLNLLLGTFNLLPVPPLDGSTGIAVFMSEEQGRSYLGCLRGNSYASLGLLVALLFFRQVLPVRGIATTFMRRIFALARHFGSNCSHFVSLQRPRNPESKRSNRIRTVQTVSICGFFPSRSGALNAKHFSAFPIIAPL